MANKMDISPETQAANRILYHDYAKSVADEADWHAQMTTGQELGHPFAAPAPSDEDGTDQAAQQADRMNDVDEEVLHVDRLHLPRGHVVAVGEAARKHQDLEIPQPLRALAEGVQVHPRRPAADHLEGGLCLVVAVRAGCPEDQGVRDGHGERSVNAGVCA